MMACKRRVVSCLLYRIWFVEYPSRHQMGWCVLARLCLGWRGETESCHARRRARRNVLSHAARRVYMSRSRATIPRHSPSGWLSWLGAAQPPQHIASTPPLFTTVSCSNNNARHLAHTVTLQPRRQNGAQTVFQNNQKTTEKESAESADMELDSFSADIREEVSNGDVETDTPKRRVVRVFSFFLQALKQAILMQ